MMWEKDTRSLRVSAGWGGLCGIAEGELEMFGWFEYIETASRPYPVHCLDTPKNRAANEKRTQRDEKMESNR